MLDRLRAGEGQKTPMFGLSYSAWADFWEWYVGRVRLLLADLTYPWRFVSGSDYDAVLHLKFSRTIFRIADQIQLIQSGLPEYVRRYLTFDIVDQFSSLHSPASSEGQVKRFKQLFSSETALRVEAALMSSPLEAVGASAAQRVHGDIMAGLQAGYLHSPADSEPERLELLRTLRNSRHGYFLRDQKMERLLMRHRGSLSEHFADWATLLWLWAVSEPEEAFGLPPK